MKNAGCREKACKCAHQPPCPFCLLHNVPLYYGEGDFRGERYQRSWGQCTEAIGSVYGDYCWMCWYFLQYVY
ncbi:hypothetical protein AB205_0217580 [Aquarana catesbeiana]|uniref:Uncharacterized protein n=1 Tax=Aquarana catesbeiana TaxID=8400 RepID=A0A2G9RX47_AQUCT|nr:hypothetical protein AB205_0217580 [Aquarana catesbeiana]